MAALSIFRNFSEWTAYNAIRFAILFGTTVQCYDGVFATLYLRRLKDQRLTPRSLHWLLRRRPISYLPMSEAVVCRLLMTYTKSDGDSSPSGENDDAMEFALLLYAFCSLLIILLQQDTLIQGLNSPKASTLGKVDVAPRR